MTPPTLDERLREIAQDWQGMTPADCTGEVLGDFLDRVFRAILADTSPASQERNEDEDFGRELLDIADEPDMYADQEVGDLVWLCSQLTEVSDPRVWRDRKAAKDRILARLRSGSQTEYEQEIRSDERKKVLDVVREDVRECRIPAMYRVRVYRILDRLTEGEEK